LVETTSGSLGGLVNEQRLSELPLNGRNFNDLVLLQTGIKVLVSTRMNSPSGKHPNLNLTFPTPQNGECGSNSSRSDRAVASCLPTIRPESADSLPTETIHKTGLCTASLLFGKQTTKRVFAEDLCRQIQGVVKNKTP